uniref:Splicing factor n=1 Tax=Pararge aegeria TaxID=116150 RepID=S4PY98_9NEOP
MQFSGKDAANSAYPTQWALNPTAYQNVDSSQVDWAALAQQWIAMKEAVAIVAPPTQKPEEEGEAPMEVENPETSCESPNASNSEWNASSNSWGGSWNQWGWGWPNSGSSDAKMTGDPSMNMAPMMDGFSSDSTAPMPGYNTGSTPAPTFQHGYWTAPQAEQSNRSSSSRDRRSKSKNRENKSSRNRTPREKPIMLPPVIEPVVLPTPVPMPTIDAAKRRQLPAWIREGLEKMEREKQKAIEREEELRAREIAEIEKKRLEEEELARIKAEAGDGPVIPVKSKFESESEGEELEGSQEEEPAPPLPAETEEPADEPDQSPLVKKSKEEIMQEVMLAVRRSLTEILLEVTDGEVLAVSQEELTRYIAAQGICLLALTRPTPRQTSRHLYIPPRTSLLTLLLVH